VAWDPANWKPDEPLMSYDTQIQAPLIDALGTPVDVRMDPVDLGSLIGSAVGGVGESREGFKRTWKQELPFLHRLLAADAFAAEGQLVKSMGTHLGLFLAFEDGRTVADDYTKSVGGSGWGKLHRLKNALPPRRLLEQRQEFYGALFHAHSDSFPFAWIGAGFAFACDQAASARLNLKAADLARLRREGMVQACVSAAAIVMTARQQPVRRLVQRGRFEVLAQSVL
jgi:hypothetical protein